MRPQCPKFKIKIAKNAYVMKSSPSWKGAVTSLNGTQAWQPSQFYEDGSVDSDTCKCVSIFISEGMEGETQGQFPEEN